MEAETSSARHVPDFLHRSLPAVLPMLLISIAYVDPGKWAAIVDGGARFGIDPMAFLLIFNFVAIYCQYISAKIGIITGKDLAQICSDEYDTWTCMILGVQTELSVIMLDLNMILGMAHGLNILFGWDLFSCVFLTATSGVFHLLVVLLDIEKAKSLGLYAAGFVLLSFVLGILINQPEIPLPINGILTKLSGESAFVLMALLGAAIVPHNFYLHSSIVQWHHGSTTISKSAICHNHFLAIVCVFSSLYLVTIALMNAAANEFHNTDLDLVTFQDALSPMEQVLRSPIALLYFLLGLFLANQTTALTWSLGGETVVQGFLKLDIPGWLHYVTIRVIAVLPALYCVWNSGTEGVYQLLIFTQVVIALQLPSSVIPLFRIASSRSIMGVHKISQFVEFFALIIFIGMLGLNIVFVVEMIFGSSDWVSNLRWTGGNGASVSYLVLLSAAFASFCLMLWLAATPLKSSTVLLDTQAWNWDTPEAIEKPRFKSEDSDLTETAYRGDAPVPVKEPSPALARTLEHSDVPVSTFHPDLPETIMAPDLHATTVTESCSITSFPNTPASVVKESASIPESEAVSAVINEVSDAGLRDVKTLKLETAPLVEKTVEVEGNSTVERDDDDVDTWEIEEPSKVVSTSAPFPASEGPASFRSLSGKSEDGGNSIGSLSRLAGLGRAARRQLATILDEFWGQLFDLHGQFTQDAKTKKLDVLLGVDSGPAGTSQKPDASGKEYSEYLKSVGSSRASDTSMNSGPYGSPRQTRMQSSLDSPYGLQRSSSSLRANPIQSFDPYLQNNSSNLLDAGERRYSSMRNLPSSEALEYQPANVPNSSGNLLDAGERRYSSLHSLPSSDALNYQQATTVQNSGGNLLDAGERRYSSLRSFPSSEALEYQPATVKNSGANLLDAGERRYSSLRNLTSSEALDYQPATVQNSSSNFLDAGERRYSSLRNLPTSEALDYQPATVHGYQISSYINRVGNDRNSDNRSGQMELSSLKSPSIGNNTNYRDSLAFALAQKLQKGSGLSHPPGFQNVPPSRNCQLPSDRPYYDSRFSAAPAENAANSVNTKKYHSLPDISGYAIPQRNAYLSDKSAPWDGSGGYASYASNTRYEPSSYSNSGSRTGAPLAFDELSPSKVYRGALSSQFVSGYNAGSIWSRQPFEQFGVADKIHNAAATEDVRSRPSAVPAQETTPSVLDLDGKLLKSFRQCILKLLKLEGSDWLFRQNDGVDEELIDRVAAREKFVYEIETRDMKNNNEANPSSFAVSSIPHCGEGCVWKTDLIVSFGVWCIHRVLDLSLMESRPELWGKYTYVLNHLQGVIDLAFSKPRTPLIPCFCLQIPATHPQKLSPPLSNGMLPPAAKPARGKCTTASMVLDMVKDVEIAISSRKGRTGTAAGDVAFPKGKENLASVLKRYKRRLSNKPVGGTNEGTRKVPTSAAYNS